MIKEFRPALLFLGKFLAIYFIGNILYGIFIESYGTKADPVTVSVTMQTCNIIHQTVADCRYETNLSRPTVDLSTNGRTMLAIFEGCNGINVMIVFVAFVIAFGGPAKKQLWFIPTGISVIHVCNLIRLTLLYSTALYNKQYFYYFHKYFFTAALYLVVFILWFLWAGVLNPQSKSRVRA